MNRNFNIIKLRAVKRKFFFSQNLFLRKFYKKTASFIPGSRTFVMWVMSVLGRVIGVASKKSKFYVVKLGSCDARIIASVGNPIYSVGQCTSAVAFRAPTISAFTLYELSDAVVIGGSNMIIYNKSLITHDLYDFEFDLTSEELWGRITANPNSKSFYLNFDYRPELFLNSAISLLDACSSNYCHWVSEILPKLVMTFANKDIRGIPIIIDENLHNNLLESLRLVVGMDAKIYSVESNVSISVGRLYVPSVCGYVPFGVKKRNITGEFHGGFYVPALKLLKNSIATKEDVSGAKPLKKVYLSRRSEIRAIRNSKSVEELLGKYGFEIVFTEDYSFSSQVKLFHNVSHIVAPTGAALVNAVFCSPGTKVCVFMGDHPEMIYDYWKNMLEPIGLNIRIIKNSMANKRSGIHGDYFVDTLQLKNLLREWAL